MKHGKAMHHISWNVTKKCNLYCRHCYRDSSPDERTEEELTTEEGKQLLEDIKKAGLDIIVFSGGEPLMRSDIFELIAHAKTIGLTPLMGSNGTLITPETASRLKKSGLNAIAISIDSAEPKIHDQFRGTKSALAMAMNGIRNSINHGLKVQVNCTVSKFNVNEIDEILKLAESHGAASCHMLFLVDVGRGKNIDSTQLTKEEYKETIHKILQSRSDMRVKPTCAPQYKVEALLKGLPSVGGRGCIAGISYCSVLPNGDVHICPYTPVKVDSIRKRPFDEIWRGNEVFNKLRDFSQYSGKCGECGYIKICGGCRARAFSATGDWLGADPYCLLDTEVKATKKNKSNYQ